MENTRRFISKKATGPNTPRVAQRVLPTPPSSETPVFRLPPGGNAVGSPRGHDARPGVAQNKQTTTASPKLNIAHFINRKGPNRDSHPGNAPRPPSHRRRSPQPQNPEATGLPSTHALSMLGRPTGILPPLTRQTSPMSPGTTGPPVQPSDARFSSPVSSIAENDQSLDGEIALDGPGADLNDSGAHTASLTVFSHSRTAVDPRHKFQPRSVPGRNPRPPTPDVGLNDSDAGSPSPAAFSKRRAEDYSVHALSKRPRFRYDYEEGNYSPTAPIRPELPVTIQPEPSSQSGNSFSASLDAYIRAHHGEWMAAQKRWEDCTMEEWKNGPAELVAEFNKIMDMIKDFMGKRMEVYAGINTSVDAHKLRLDARDAMLAKEKGRLVKQAGGLAGPFAVN